MVATVTRHAVEHGESRQRPKTPPKKEIKNQTANGNHHRQYRHSNQPTNQHRPINLQRSEKEGEVVGFSGC